MLLTPISTSDRGVDGEGYHVERHGTGARSEVLEDAAGEDVEWGV